MRVFAIALLSLTAIAGEANASSIVKVENTDPAAIRSIMRLGAAAPAVTGEKVSAIPAPGNAGHRRPGRTLPVMVMRGGIVGDAFAAATPVPSAPAVTEASAQPSATPAPVQADMQPSAAAEPESARPVAEPR